MAEPSNAPADVVDDVRTTVGLCRRGRRLLRVRRDRLRRRALGRTTSVERGNDRCRAACTSSGEFMEANLGTEVRPDGSAIVRVIAQQYSFVPACIVVPAETPGRVPRDQSRRGARVPHRRHQREQHGGARVRRRGAYALRQAGRSPDAVPRVLQRRAPGHVGAGQGASIAANSRDPTAASREHPVHGSSRLVLAHFWAAFAVVRRHDSARGVADAGAQPPASLGRPGTVLPGGHGARHHARLRLSDARRDGIRLCGLRGVARPADARHAARLDGSLAGDRGRRDGACDRGRRQGDGSLHVLSAADWAARIITSAS